MFYNVAALNQGEKVQHHRALLLPLWTIVVPKTTIHEACSLPYQSISIQNQFVFKDWLEYMNRPYTCYYKIADNEISLEKCLSNEYGFNVSICWVRNTLKLQPLSSDIIYFVGLYKQIIKRP